MSLELQDIVDQPSYGSVASAPEASQQSFVTIEVDEVDSSRPTLAPVGTRLKRNAQIEYNPFDWRRTLFAVRGRPHISGSFYVVYCIGTALVLISSLAELGADQTRTCRAWCSRIAIGSQPHQYMGFILFLIMAFRTKTSYQHYVRGQAAYYEVKSNILNFVHVLLHSIPRASIPRNRRARIVAHIVSFPFALTSELRRERDFDTSQTRSILCDEDLKTIQGAASMPLFILDSLSQMITEYCSEVPLAQKGALYRSVGNLYKPYCEAERIGTNPMGFSYVAHMRLLLVIYLTTLPLALVEQMGYSTIPVFWVIAYSLMSLEMLAVEVENPFGYQGSDLRLYQYNVILRDNVRQSWNSWRVDHEATHRDVARQEKYEDFGVRDRHDEKLEGFEYW